MEFILSRLRSKKFIHLYAEPNCLYIRVNVSGVKGSPSGVIKTFDEQKLDWSQVYLKLNSTAEQNLDWKNVHTIPNAINS